MKHTPEEVQEVIDDFYLEGSDDEDVVNKIYECLEAYKELLTKELEGNQNEVHS